ncbi:hypothetical protein ACFV3E_42230, partial [Streptomyces sp. NPDC059718]
RPGRLASPAGGGCWAGAGGAGPRHHRGRGLPIVAALASDHGLTVRPGAGICWADLPLDRPRRDGEGGDRAASVALTTAFAALLLVAVFTAGCLLELV